MPVLGSGQKFGHDEPARGRGRDDRAGDVGDGDAAEAGFLAVDLDAHGRIIERPGQSEGRAATATPSAPARSFSA